MGTIRRLAVGAVSGAVGTAAMDLLWYRRYRRDGGQDSAWSWETAGVTRWDEASAPGRLGEKVERLVTRRQPPDRWARPTTNLVHWATGAAWGFQYAALAAARPSKHPVRRALALGPAAWLSGYVLLPLAGVYKPIWDYDARTLGKDLSAHLLYGATTSVAFAALTRSA